MHYTLQFSLDCITGVSEGERKKSERRVMECPPATSTNRRKLKFHNMQKPVSSNPLLPFLLTHLAVTQCKFQLKSVLSRGTTQQQYQALMKLPTDLIRVPLLIVRTRHSKIKCHTLPDTPNQVHYHSRELKTLRRISLK